MGEIVYIWMTTLMHLAVNSEIIKKLFMNYEIEHVGVHLLDIAEKETPEEICIYDVAKQRMIQWKQVSPQQPKEIIVFIYAKFWFLFLPGLGLLPRDFVFVQQ